MMEAGILFPEILSFGKFEMKEVKISRDKRKRLKKKARRDFSSREESTDVLSLCSEGMSPAIGVEDAVKKRKPEPLQLSDVLPAVEDEDSLLDVLPIVEDENSLLDVLPIVEDDDTVERKLVSPSTLLSPLVAVHSFVNDKSSLLPLCLPINFSACTQGNTVPPGSDRFDDDGPLSSDEHCLVKTRFGSNNLKQVKDSINIESNLGLVAPRLKRKSHSKSIANGHRYNFRTRLKKV